LADTFVSESFFQAKTSKSSLSKVAWAEVRDWHRKHHGKYNVESSYPKCKGKYQKEKRLGFSLLYHSKFHFEKHIYLFIYFYFIIHMHIQGLGHFSSLPPPPPLPPTPPPHSPSHPLNTQQKLFCHF
jgi:hypothetical protein